MSYTEKHIVETYSALFEGLSAETKIELIGQLSKSLEAEKKHQDDKFFRSFGAFGSDKPAAAIIAEIKAARNFRRKKIGL